MYISSDPLNDELKIIHDKMNTILNKHNIAAYHPLKSGYKFAPVLV